MRSLTTGSPELAAETNNSVTTGRQKLEDQGLQLMGLELQNWDRIKVDKNEPVSKGSEN